jgi:chromate reductase, NAD(P)H dehydrogenase (quinone)
MTNALTGIAPVSLKLEIIEIGGLPLNDEDPENNLPVDYTKFREQIMKFTVPHNITFKTFS